MSAISDHERLTRTAACPTCSAAAGKPCAAVDHPHEHRAPGTLRRLSHRQRGLAYWAARESAPVAAPDAHVSYVPGEDPGIAVLREMVNDNREWLGIDGDGGGEER